MTVHLQLEAATADHLRALIAGPDDFKAHFDLTVIPGYLEADDVLERVLRDVDAGADRAWNTYLFVQPDDRALIGLGGFKGPPTNGMVEIGYGVAPAYRRQGYATEAARLMIGIAGEAGVTTVIAHTRAEPNPSTRVLAGHGFTKTDTIEDSEDGTIWRWELPLTD